MDIFANIKEIKYRPFLCRKLNIFNITDLGNALSKEATFILEINEKSRIAVSWWVSAKRTRSYPYTRVYDSLSFTGKKLTIIPIFKDEGRDGDRDFLQWDTISLMSLLGIYVVIAYYNSAKANTEFKNKITEQRFDVNYIKSEIEHLLTYQSDALHWNLSQIDKIGEIGKKALESYEKISKGTGIKMHSSTSATKRVDELLKDKKVFMALSRTLAEKAQKRERVTKQPKEDLKGQKATLTISNYLGGFYYFTVDEAKIAKNNVLLIEGKHTKTNNLPALEDIKDGLLKMIIFTNLAEARIKKQNYGSISILKLTTARDFKLESLNKSQRETLNLLKSEAKINGFKILINGKYFENS